MATANRKEGAAAPSNVVRIGNLGNELRVSLNHCRSPRMLDNWMTNFRRHMGKLTPEQSEDLAHRSIAAIRRVCPVQDAPSAGGAA